MSQPEKVPLMVRLPADLHRLVKDSAEANDQSLNKEIIHHLRRSLTGYTQHR